MKHRVMIAALPFMLAACSSTQQEVAQAPQPAQPVTQRVEAPVTPPAAMNAAGEYEFTTMVNGQSVSGTMLIVKTGENYSGKILTDVVPEIPLSKVVVAGNKVTLSGTMSDGGTIEMIMNFVGNDFTGTWSYGGDGGDMKGKRK